MNSTTKIIAGVAVLALLFAGIGFAVEYKATTVTEDNKIGVAYLTVNKDVTSANAKLIMDGSFVAFDTTTTDGAVTYSNIQKDIKPGQIIIANGGSAAAEDVTLTITPGTGFTAANFVLTIEDTTVSFADNKYTYAIDEIAAGGSVTLDVAFTVADSFTIDDPSDVDAIKGPFTFTIVASANTETA